MRDDTLTKTEIDQAAREFKSSIIDGSTVFIEEVDGRKEYLVLDGDDNFRLTIYSDLTANQETNKALYNEGRPQGSEFFKFASFPIDFLDVYGFHNALPAQWYYKKEYLGLLVRMAHDPAYRDFRTAPGNFIRKGFS